MSAKRPPKPAAFDPAAAPLDGLSVIEANAGTGKTWTITALYVRLLLERALPVDSILVVTFTEAATGELRDRIRNRIAEIRDAFECGRAAAGDTFAAALLERIENRKDALTRLAAALTGFDQAPVHTIHGFCQRALGDQAFESAMPFRTEIVPDQSALLREVVDDFWRREVYAASEGFTRYLFSEGIGPDALREEIARFVGKPYLRALPRGEPKDMSRIEREYAHAYEALRKAWRSERAAVVGKLVRNPSLYAKYSEEAVGAWMLEMDACLAPETAHPDLCGAFERFTTRGLAGATRKGATAPDHAAFRLCEKLRDAHAALGAAYASEAAHLKVRLLEYCNAELEKRKAARQLQSYDDLLLNLQRALDGAGGDVLAKTLRGRYAAALIDEFQDTDPVQYSIFSRIYAEGGQPVFFVGDPKQSIYSFRGADVYTHLDARGKASRAHTLSVNWRSSPRLLDAVNRLFLAAPDPFVIPEVPFTPSSAATGDRGRLVVEGDEGAPFHVWFVEPGEKGKPRSKASVRSAAAAATAAEVARLLNLASGARAQIVIEGKAPRPLRGGDIAVLVRAHSEAQLVRSALAQCGVSAVQRGSQSVFVQPEAEALERVLAAIAEPGREALVGAALATDLIGMSGEDLYAQRGDEQQWEATLESFREAHRDWHERGFMAMLRAFFARHDVLNRVLAFGDGERRATNLLHLAEILHCEAAGHGMGGLLAWFASKRGMPEQGNEAELLRLESDENLVKILTVHVSKGLEFPVTFCPFVWDGDIKSERSNGKALAFHDPGHDDRPTVDFGSDAFDAARDQAVLEERAENLRLLYVALTRAKYRCTIVWGHVNSADTAALAWLAHRGADGAVRLDDMRGDLGRIAARAEGAIDIADFPPVDPVRYEARADASGTLASRVFERALHDNRRVTSFTALAHGRSIEAPDYDAGDREPLPESVAGRDIFAFPRGAQAGTCLHAIFEDVDFTHLARPDLERIVGKGLALHGFDASWVRTVADMVQAVAETPLDDTGMKLATVTRQRRLDELEFYYPLEGLSAPALRRCLLAWGFPDEIRERIGELSFAPAQGYMRGFIDLVFEHGGRYYLADYKSNWLGPTVAAYDARAMSRAMARETYYLQYLVYCVALHRYLASRVRGYSYESHFGGVRYLFVRGMRPNAAFGVYADRPEEGLVRALDALLGSGGA